MLCRLAKSPGKAFIRHGSSLFEVPANKLRNVTLTLYKVHTPHISRTLSQTAPNGLLANGDCAKEQTRDIHLTQKWDSPCGFALLGCQQWDKRAPIVLSKSVQSRGVSGHFAECQLSSDDGLQFTRSKILGNLCFLGFSPRICSFNTMQTTRASSTTSAAATKRRSEVSEEPRVSPKEDEPDLKESPSPSEKESGPPEAAPEGEKPNKTQQLKKVFKEYGAVGVSFHICMSLMSLGMFYLLVSSGIDMAALLCKLGFSEAVVKSKMAAGTSTFVLAYAVHKLFAPVRISITLVSVPLIVRHFRKIGLFKTPPTAP